MTGPSADRDADTNPTTAVVARFGPRDWRQQGAQYVIRHTLRDVGADSYLRVRGTSTDGAEPLAGGLEGPWSDLWFYSPPPPRGGGGGRGGTGSRVHGGRRLATKRPH
ncbi:hypothetical protein [Micromonospora harpali]|uniref:Uncharacterized protein n=1 Tax=Micromonospora harpali TaxID=1490225 RepID=A0ABW1HJ66_9ACTN